MAVGPEPPAVTAGDAVWGDHFKEVTCELIFSLSKLPGGFSGSQNTQADAA